MTRDTTKFHYRLTQCLIIIVVLLLIMFYAGAAQANRPNSRSFAKGSVMKRSEFKAKFDKRKYRTSVHINSNRVVMVLHKKRTAVSRASLFAHNNKRGKYKPMAETDQPTGVTSAN